MSLEKQNDVQKNILLKQPEFLRYLADCGNLSVDTACQQYMRELDQRYIDKHLKTRRIWQGKNGSWNTRWEDENGRVKLVSKKKKEVLEAAIIAHYKEIEERPTVRKVFYEWMDERLDFREIQKGTFDRAVTDFQRFFVESGFASRSIDTIDGDDLSAFIKSAIRDHNLSQKAWANLKGIIFGLFAYAKEKRYTLFSISTFFGDLKLPRNMFRKVIVNDDDQIFSNEEVIRIVEWINGKEERLQSLTNLGILFCFYTGLRAGELSTIKYSDFDDNMLLVTRTETRCKAESGEYVFEIRESTKGRDGIRSIIVPPEGLRVIELVRRINPDGEFVFMDGERRIKGDRFSDKLKRICNYLGIKPRSLHKIRKTYASVLLDSGCSEKLIMNQMGHTDIRTTLGHYYFDRKNRAANILAINEAFSDLYTPGPRDEAKNLTPAG